MEALNIRLHTLFLFRLQFWSSTPLNQLLLIMNEFFQSRHVKTLATNQIGNLDRHNVDHLISSLDDDLIFSKITESVMSSSLGSMLQMFGGSEALEPLREPICKKVNSFLSP